MPYRSNTSATVTKKAPSAWPWVVLAILVAAAVGGWFYTRQDQRDLQAQRVAPLPMVESASLGAGPPQVGTLAAPRHPVSPPGGLTGSGMAGSTGEQSFFDVLKRALGGTPDVATTHAAGNVPMDAFLIPEGFVRRVVATVDALGRRGPIPPRIRPVPVTPGLVAVQGEGTKVVLGAANAARYKPFIDALSHVDMRIVAAIYIHYYPLFQTAYEKLGFPNGYFNDRLIQVIDIMLSTPQVQGPIELVQPHVLYQFADPALEALPAGQKIMIRIGPQNAAVVRGKLRELRAALVVGHPAAK